MGENIKALIDQLKSFRTRSDAKMRLLEAGSAAVDPLLGALHDPSEGVRYVAASVLGKLRDEKAIDPLIEAMNDPACSSAAADALKELTGEDFGVNPGRWAAWHKGEVVPQEGAPSRGKPAPLTDPELVRQALAGLADEVDTSGDEFVARIPRHSGRFQTVRIAPARKDADGNSIIFIDTVCGPASKPHYEWALRKNLEVPFGAIAVRDITSEPHFVLVNTLLRETADPAEVRACVKNIARWGDTIEKALQEEDAN